MVSTSLSATVDSALPQDFSGRPSARTVQQPHCSSPQPNLVPLRPRWLRSTSSKGVSPLTATLTGFPFTVRLIAGMMAPLEGAPSIPDRVVPGATRDRVLFALGDEDPRP